MLIDHWIGWIGDFGYAVLFFSLCLGLIGLPIPNEVVVATGGAAAGSGMLLPFPAWLSLYAGVVSGLTFGYFMGRRFGPSALKLLGRFGGSRRTAALPEPLARKAGSAALAFSYFVPVLRHVMPYWAGSQRVGYLRFALYAYPSALVWTAVFFGIGASIGEHAGEIGYAVYSGGLRVLWLVVAIGGAAWILYSRRVKGRTGG